MKSKDLIELYKVVENQVRQSFQRGSGIRDSLIRAIRKAFESYAKDKGIKVKAEDLKV